MKKKALATVKPRTHTALSPKIYDNLLRLIRKRLSGGVARIKAYVNNEGVAMKWDTGRLIDTHFLYHQGRADYGSRLFDRLSEDLGIDKRSLNQMVKFYRMYPNLPKEAPLTWNHYRFLTTIPDQGQRKKLENRLIKENLPYRYILDFKRQLKTDKKGSLPGSSIKLPLQRGHLYNYKVVKSPDAQQGKTLFLIDCGFSIFVEPPPQSSLPSLRANTLIASIKTGQGYRLKHAHTSTDSLYTYKAIVERVVDGDTIKVRIDCGFGIHSRQKLRLRAIDAPERDTVKGRRAKEFVENTLKTAPFVVIKTYGSDKYGRYLVDVFFLSSQKDAAAVAAKGRLLNQELLDNNLAGIYRK